MYYTALWLHVLLRSCFRSTTDWFGEKKEFHEHWNYGARDARAFYVFRSFFRNLKSSFSEHNMPVHALRHAIENAPKMV